MSVEERIKPKILNSQIIHKVNDYHTQIVNVSRLASVLIAGQDMYILEVAPAGYIILAANEAEKSAQRHAGRLPDVRCGRSSVPRR